MTKIRDMMGKSEIMFNIDMKLKAKLAVVHSVTVGCATITRLEIELP